MDRHMTIKPRLETVSKYFVSFYTLADDRFLITRSLVSERQRG
jgi:hypothetical protein